MTDVRPDVGGWITATADALKLHANQMIGPGLVCWGLTMLFVLPLSMAIGFGVAIAAILAEQGGGDAPVWILPVVFVVFGLFFVALMFFNGVLLHGVYRWSLALLRGEKPSFGAVVPGFGAAMVAGAIPMVQMSLGLLGLPFCLVPTIWIGLTLALAQVAAADRGQGIVDALSTSMELTSGRKLNLFLFQMVLMFVVMLISYIPIVGPIAMYPILAMAYAVVYESLTKATAQSA